MLNYLRKEISIDNECVTWEIFTRVILTQRSGYECPGYGA